MILTSSEDGTLKLWDRRNGDCVKSLSPNGKPLFSVDTNQKLICAGSTEDVFFWDLRKLKIVANYTESHADDVTCVRFNP